MRMLMRFPEGRQKALTLSYDDGVAQDIRLIGIMSKYGIKGTFNINAGCIGEEDATDHGRLSKKQILELYPKSGNEVAIHGWEHPFLESLPNVNATAEILRDRSEIEKMFGTIVRGMAYPYGTYSDDVVNSLKACGIAYSRTTVSTEWFDIPTDWLRMPATCHHNNPRLFELADRFLELKDDLRPCWLFYLWGHSYEFDFNTQSWDTIEKFCEKMGNHDEIWYATNIEIYDYVAAYKSLRTSADCSIVYNPSAIDVWARINGETVKIGAGQQLVLK